MAQRFPVRFSRINRVMMTLLGIPPGRSFVELDGDRVAVRLSWAFRSTFSRSAVSGAAARPRWRPLSAGAHGWRGRWLVNGARTGIVVVTIDPPQRAWTMGVPVRLRELAVSLDDPGAFLAALGAP